MNNSSISLDEKPKGLYLIDFIIEGSLISILILLGVLSNGAILSYNIFTKKWRKLITIEILILNSALADIVSTLFFSAFHIARLKCIFSHNCELGDFFCTFNSIILQQCLFVSVNSNFFIGLYCMTVCIIKPGATFSKRQTVSLVVGIWVWVFVFIGPSFFTGLQEVKFNETLNICSYDSYKYPPIYRALTQLPAGYLQVILTPVIYIVIFIKLSCSSKQTSQKYKKLVKSTFGIIALFFICFFPEVLVKASRISMESDFDERLLRYVHFLSMYSTGLNPVYYAFRMRNLLPQSVDRFMSRLVKCKCKHQVEPADVPLPPGPGLPAQNEDIELQELDRQ